MSGKLAISALIAYFVAAIFNSLLVVIKETQTGVKSWLKDVFGHHWIGHGVLTIAVFIIVLLVGMAVIKAELTDEKARTLTIATIIITLLSFIIILGFYILHL